MIRFCSLFSGSSGNSYFLEIDGTKLLVDAGKSGKKITEALSKIGEDIDDIYGIIITHEHEDHIKSLPLLARKHNLKVIISEGTYIMIEDRLKDIAKENIKRFETGSNFSIENIEVKSIKIPHDAADPSAFSFKDCENKKITIATDIGKATDEIVEQIKGSDILLLESNFEKNILEVSRYPYYLKRRIKGELGHLSNTETKNVVEELIGTNLKQIILGHLSKENNTEYLAYNNIYELLKKYNVEKDIGLEVAKREDQSNIYELKNNELKVYSNYDSKKDNEYTKSPGLA